MTTVTDVVLRVVTDHPGITLDEIAERAGMGKQRARACLRGLRQQKFIWRRRAWGEPYVYYAYDRPADPLDR